MDLALTDAKETSTVISTELTVVRVLKRERIPKIQQIRSVALISALFALVWYKQFVFFNRRSGTTTSSQPMLDDPSPRPILVAVSAETG
jgi:hypothetical protein